MTRLRTIRSRWPLLADLVEAVEPWLTPAGIAGGLYVVIRGALAALKLI